MPGVLERILNMDLPDNILGYLVLAIIIVILLIVIKWERLKYSCLEQAAKMVSEAEAHSELSGKEKFALCVLWINESMPKIFRNELTRQVISKVIDYTYQNSFGYMCNYVKRKTGKDIGSIVAAITETKETESSTNNDNTIG